MYIECVAILAVLGVLIFMVVRSGRRAVGLSLLPLLLAPAAYLLSAPLSGLLSALLSVDRRPIAMGVTVAGLVIACVLYGLLCGNFPSRRTRRVYLWMCGGFSLILTVLLLHDLFTAVV